MKFLLRLFLVVIALALVVIGVSFYVLRAYLTPENVTAFITESATRYGYAVEHMQVVQATPHHVRIENIALTGPQQIKAQTLDITAGISGLAANAENIHITSGEQTYRIATVLAHAIPAGFSPREILFDLEATPIEHISDLSYFAPLTLKADGVLRYPDLDAEIALSDKEERATFNTDLALNLTTQQGKAEIEVPSLNFATGALQPADLVPRLRGKLLQVNGVLEATGTILITPENLTPDITLRLRDLSGEYQGKTFTKLSTEARITQLSPLETAPGQKLTFDSLIAGIPLSKGEFSYQLRGQNELALETAKWNWGLGVLSLKPTIIPLGTEEPIMLTVDVVGLPLSDVVSLAKNEELKATGTLSGSIPLTLDKEGLRIDNGLLATAEPGTLVYAPPIGSEQSGQPQLQLLQDLLKDFHYKNLRLALASTPDQKLKAELYLEGNNPAVYDGRPVQLTINITGDVLSLIQRSADIYALPEEILKQMQSGEPRVR